jgi:hypothetical protein
VDTTEFFNGIDPTRTLQSARGALLRGSSPARFLRQLFFDPRGCVRAAD